MRKTNAKTGTSKPSRKSPPRSPRRAFEAVLTSRPPKAGRPMRLTEAFMREFLGHLSLGLPIQHCSSLCGAAPTQVSDWLRDGRRAEERGEHSIARRFSEAVRATLADLQRQHLGSLVIYQRMAEGWLPSCKACARGGKPCGRHPRNLRLAADLSWKMLSHRFPADWGTTTVRHEVGLGHDEATGGAAAGGEGASAAVVGLAIFLPKRHDDV